ncbi:hypothetical protein PG993_009169 [Apiospora rasikravindrae]|uniref:Uncharacterized protein n=1 Tax=Apiospora rasikravindrae TaxID=990691 RepID=A0ABR1SKF0_9PEZI
METTKMARSKRATTRFRAALLMMGQLMVTLIVILVFAVAFAVQANTIKMPSWAETWQGVEPAQRSTYAASLLGTVTLIFVLFFGVIVILIIREGRSGT